MEFGLMTFADTVPETGHGMAQCTYKRLSELIEEIKLADELDLDVFGVGEHHRPDYAVSSPATILAAAAVVTKRIKLASAVTVLSSDDPVRVFQQFATVDQLSGGRAEIMAGRGSFIESFPLFGYDLKHYNDLFSEKVDLLLKINKNEIVNWQGMHRAPIVDRGVYPRPLQQELPIWIAAGGTPESAIRAAKKNLPLMLAIIGGNPEQFVPFIELYRETLRKEHNISEGTRIGVNNHFYVSEDSQKAAKDFYPYYSAVMGRIRKERGWPPLTVEKYEELRSTNGALMVGSVQQVIEKILHEHELFGNTRFMAQTSLGQLPHTQTLKSMELFGTQVVPAVKKALEKKSSTKKPSNLRIHTD